MHRLAAEQRLYCKCAVFAPRINPQSVHSTHQFREFRVLFPMALVCSVPCSCDRQSNWNLDWKFMFPLVRKSAVILCCHWYLIDIKFVLWVVQLNGQQSTNWYFGWRFDSFFHNTRLLPTLGIFIYGFFNGYFYICAIDFNLQCGLSTIIFSRVIIVNLEWIAAFDEFIICS